MRIRYDDGQEDSAGNPKGSRVIQPMAIGTTKKGYPVVRAWQEGGGSRRGVPRWKFFRLDRITSWRPMNNKKFFQAPNGYNPNGDKTMGTFIDNAKFDDFISPLERQRQQFQNDVKMGKQRTNQVGPIQQPRVTQQWKKNVLRGQSVKSIDINLTRGEHTLSIRALDDNIILDQWMIDFNKNRKHYLFPID